jgi:hypothetical protein
MFNRYLRTPAHVRMAMLICILCGLSTAQALSQPGPAPALQNDEVIQRIDAAVRHRTDRVAGYTVLEIYSIYRNREPNPTAQVTVKTVYKRGSGKEYTPISATGSSFLRSVIVDRILANEKEMAKAANRESVALTSANYKMQLEPGHATINGRDCVIVNLKARRKAAYLINGKGWFDSTDFTLVHLEGSPAQSPSVFARDMAGERDYTRVDGFSMALHAEIHTHSFLFGDTLMKIDYTGYQIQLDPQASRSAE